MNRLLRRPLTLLLALAAAACSGNSTGPDDRPNDPATAARVSVDRFSVAAATLMERTATNGMPAANAPVNFDAAPFITTGYGPAGQVLRYYNFDVQTTAPAPIYVLFRTGESAPVANQLNIIDVLPGDPGYNDFWQVVRVTVPANYVANTISSVQEVFDSGYSRTTTTTLVNCPVVPAGSTATLRLAGESAAITQGWYRGMVVHYFTFGEKAISTTAGGLVPTSGIFVTFNINPPLAGGGPPSGFVVETGTSQTHNVLATMPADAAYSPLWSVNIYNNSAFGSVRNLATATAAPLLVAGAALVNCPVVGVP